MLFRAIWATHRRNGKNRTLRPSKNHSSLKNAPECDYSSFYVTSGTGTPGCLVAQDLALLTKVRSLIHEEISLLTVPYFPFRARTPTMHLSHSCTDNIFATSGSAFEQRTTYTGLRFPFATMPQQSPLLIGVVHLPDFRHDSVRHG
jgi:hypothetical protein